MLIILIHFSFDWYRILGPKSGSGSETLALPASIERVSSAPGSPERGGDRVGQRPAAAESDGADSHAHWPEPSTWMNSNIGIVYI